MILARHSLPHGVMVTQQILNLLFKVRILVRQPLSKSNVWFVAKESLRLRARPFTRLFSRQFQPAIKT